MHGQPRFRLLSVFVVTTVWALLLNTAPLSASLSTSVGTQFVQWATPANSLGDFTTIDHPLTNNQPNAIIFATPNWNPGGVGGVYDNRPIGVFYTGTNWAVFNQDLQPIPTNAAFNILIPPPDASVFVHTATVANIAFNYTDIDNPLTNNQPNAILHVTPNWNPGGAGGTYDNHPIGAWFNPASQKWSIFNQDLAAMPVNAAFNVLVFPGVGGPAFVHRATASNSVSDFTIINNPLTNNRPNAIVHVTPNWNPGGAGGTYDNHPIGVFYIGGGTQKWAIFNQDLTAIPINASFNVVVPIDDLGLFVHTATASNSTGDFTVIDNPQTNNQPNAIVLASPNWNPGGSGGTYDNHPIGVFYIGGGTQKWAIFNQDLTAIPVNAAFNVLVPPVDTAVFVHKATPSNSAGDFTVIDNPLTNNRPDAIVHVTPNWNPGGVGGTYNNHPIGVFYITGGTEKWAIFNQDIAAVPANASFNVYVPPPGPTVFVHTATAGNSTFDYTLIDNPVTNNQPDARLFATSNWNPNGAGGTYNNHNIGVFYAGSASIPEVVSGKHAVFNQDLAAIPVNAAFNLLAFQPQALVAAVLPLSRSVQVGGAQATAFAAIINIGAATALNCAPAPPLSPPANLGTFTYQTTSPANVLTGTPNTPANIAPGAIQNFVFGFSPTGPIPETSLAMRFACGNVVDAPQFPGVNNFFMVAETSPVPDTIALMATPTGDGIVHVASPSSTQLFAIGTSNVGATGTIVVSADDGGRGLPLTLTVCETTGGPVCLSPPTPTVTVNYLAGTNRSFAFFAQAFGSIAFDPANNRVFARLRQSGSGVLRGATSAAVCTMPNAGC